ncbi:DUF2550 domain-containing protein [Corynebacterium lizhenjunii]|uniref:DUF2550 domain-containing protein n=2 Tax=Corynebacterium lizhenjunii TaxID=2709394 RepID=A0A7T0KGJ2_9CORY|nr:DUF2550 domain-containing protein [Corynebacterium lizhenjunii]QPK80300.1 DUF2550 domain-containing protein [Corynebacterium lizhenjunii]
MRVISPAVVVFWIALAVLVVAGGLAAVRFVKLRSSGAQVLVRELPAKDSYSWRHGIVRYTGEHMECFKLRSLWPAPDLKIPRLDVSIVGTRTLDDEEASFMPDATNAVEIAAGDRHFEFALDQRGAMALQAWVESAPSRRQERADAKVLRERMERSKRRQ